MPTPSQHAFSEKVALITDGSNPIGRAVAMQLALYGSYVIVGFSKTSDEDKRTLEELKSLGTLANAFEYDVSSVDGIKNLVAEVENLYGRLDLLVNCLKFQGDSEFENTGEDVFDETLNVGLKASFFVIREAMRLMKPRPKPKIVNVVSAVDTFETEKNIAFASANQAMIGMTKSLAVTLPKNFRVNAVAVSEKEKPRSHFDKFDKPDADLFRVKKGIDADDVARTILYLLSSESIGLNGQIIKVG
jgi:NAD(P)-dependent dehydrogenase (short-subunit alcohol dehydrogenase family)